MPQTSDDSLLVGGMKKSEYRFVVMKGLLCFKIKRSLNSYRMTEYKKRVLVSVGYIGLYGAESLTAVYKPF